MTARIARVIALLLLALAGALSVAVFVGALDWGAPGSAGSTPLAGLFRGVLYAVLGGLLLVLVVGLVLELRQQPRTIVNRRLELIWIALPVLALLGVALGERELRAGYEPPRVEITAGLEAWTGAELEAFAGEPLSIALRSSDGAHTLAVPALAVEFAVVPGEVTTGHVPAPRVGEFAITCTVHERAVGRLRIVPAR